MYFVQFTLYKDSLFSPLSQIIETNVIGFGGPSAMCGITSPKLIMRPPLYKQVGSLGTQSA